MDPITHRNRIAKMTFASVYPMYVQKVERKGRTKEELHQVIEWLTGFNDKKFYETANENVVQSFSSTVFEVVIRRPRLAVIIRFFSELAHFTIA